MQAEFRGRRAAGGFDLKRHVRMRRHAMMKTRLVVVALMSFALVLPAFAKI
jgi:hypothetical protein